jgi:hypothetical protein
MSILPFLLLCLAVILVGAGIVGGGKPLGWIAIGLSVLALIFYLGAIR